MTKKITIGTKGEGFDLDILLTTRLLIQANSGGGKSYLLRKLIEELFGRVQIIIIDPEGEFATLREQYDFILVGKGGETPADPRSAALLAEKLLELNASAICDIYELKAMERHRWVKLFLDSMINAPKNLWHPVVVVVDEAHIFAPEKGQGESEAYGSMIDLATRGRKRGYCAVFATQRLGKLSKNASAELQNVLIGSTFQDIDRKRAAETLGVPKSDEREFSNQMKLLEPGNFFALGRAISRDRIAIKIQKAVTSHPQSGKNYKVSPPPPTAKVRAFLPSLADLPKEADDKARTTAELKKEISELRKQLSKQPVQQPQNSAELTDHKKKFKDLLAKYTKLVADVRLIESLFRKPIERLTELLQADDNIVASISPPRPTIVKPVAKVEAPRRIPLVIESNGALSRAERKILTALAHYPEGRTKIQAAILSGYAVSGGGFNNAIGSCRSKGYLSGNGEALMITDEGSQILGPLDPLPEGDELFQYWITQISKAERSILQALKDAHPDELQKEQVAERSGYEVSGGGFNNALGRLRSLELISGRQALKLSENLI